MNDRVLYRRSQRRFASALQRSSEALGSAQAWLHPRGVREGAVKSLSDRVLFPKAYRQVGGTIPFIVGSYSYFRVLPIT